MGFKSRKQVLFIAIMLLAFILVAVIYAVSRLNTNTNEENINSEIPVSAPLSYSQEGIIGDVPINDEIETVGQVEGISTSAPVPVHIAPQTKHVNPELPSTPNLPMLPNSNPQPIPTEIIEEDKCTNPENTWLEFKLGNSEYQQFGGNGTHYTYLEGSTYSKIAAFLSYSCIDRSEIIEMWYNVTSDEVYCNCGEIYIPGVQPGDYEMLYLVGVRDVVYYDYIYLTIEAKPKPPINNEPEAIILTPRLYFEKRVITGNSYVLDLYGEMRDQEDGVITSGSSLKWYIDENPGLTYLFDGRGLYTVTVPTCGTVAVTPVLRVWDSQGRMDDEAFTIVLINEDCSEPLE